MYVVRRDSPGGDSRPRLVLIGKSGRVVTPLASLPHLALLTLRFGILNPKLLVLPNLQRPIFASDILHAFRPQFRTFLRTPSPHTKLDRFGFGTAGLGVLRVGFDGSFAGVETTETESVPEQRPAAGDIGN